MTMTAIKTHCIIELGLNQTPCVTHQKLMYRLYSKYNYSYDFFCTFCLLCKVCETYVCMLYADYFLQQLECTTWGTYRWAAAWPESLLLFPSPAGRVVYLIRVEENGFHTKSIYNQITLLLQIHFRVSISHSHHHPRSPSSQRTCTLISLLILII